MTQNGESLSRPDMVQCSTNVKLCCASHNPSYPQPTDSPSKAAFLYLSVGRMRFTAR